MSNPEITATLAVRVPVNATGDLVEGAATVLSRVDGVRRVEEAEVRGLQPGLNDTVVDLEVRVSVGDRGEDLAVIRRELADGVGVVGVEDLKATEDAIEAGPSVHPPPGVG